MDIVSNSFKKCKSEENLNFEFQTHHLTAGFKLDKQQLHCSEKNDVDTRKSVFEMETNPVTTARFNMGKDLNCSDNQEKNDIDTRKSEDLNCLEKKSSSTMEKSHSDDEEKEEEEYVCYVCGLRGHKFLDYYFSGGCNQKEEVAHRYCASLELGKGLEDCANLEGGKGENLEVEGGKGMSPQLSAFFQKLAETETSVIDYFIMKKKHDDQK